MLPSGELARGHLSVVALDDAKVDEAKLVPPLGVLEDLLQQHRVRLALAAHFAAAGGCAFLMAIAALLLTTAYLPKPSADSIRQK